MEERGAGSLLDILARSCPALGITLLFFFFNALSGKRTFK